MRKALAFALLTILFSVLLAGPAAAQGNADDEGVLLRVNGDVVVQAGETHGVVVVVDGNLDFDGTATTIVVVNGTANLNGATLTTLVVVSGRANLGPGTTVTGDVRLVDSPLTQDSTAIVEGSISKGADSDFFNGFWIVGLLFMIGWAVLVVLGGLLLAAIAPDLARRAGRTITSDLGPTILAALLVWIVIPIVGVLLFATIVGIPTALALWLVALPALGFVGFLVAGIRIGEYITARNGGVGHPYLASFVGLVALIIVGAVPVIGPLVVAIAGFLGSGALALHAFRAIRGPQQPAVSTPEPPEPETSPPEPSQPEPSPPDPTGATP